MPKLLSSLVVVLFIFLFSACKKENSIELNFSTDITTNTIVNGRNTSFDNFKMYFSNIKFITENNDTLNVKDIFLFDLKKDNQIIFANNAKHTITKIHVGFGLDSLLNNSMPSTFEAKHPLSVEQGMYWTMLKYRFLNTEGVLDSSFLKNQPASFPFSLHLGRNQIYRTKIYKLDNPVQNGKIKIKINYTKMFQKNDTLLDSKVYFSNHSEAYDMEDAELLFGNLVNGITISIE